MTRPVTTMPEKRSPTELSSVVVGTDSDANAPVKRPITTLLGAIFVFFRAAAGALWLAVLALIWGDLTLEDDLTPDESRLFLIIILIVGAVFILVLLALGVLILIGSNVARVLVMLGLTLSITTAAIGYFTAGEEITMHTTLLTLALDILVLLALSSRDARAWSRGRYARRAARVTGGSGGRT